MLVHNFASFAEALTAAEVRRDECLIRGVPGPLFPLDGEPVLRRLHHAAGFCRSSGTFLAKEGAARCGLTEANVCWLAPFVEVPTPWVMVDIDGIPSPDGAAWIAEPEAAVEFVRDNHLPPCFLDASCWWQVTASAHDPSKEGGRDLMRLRLGFWLSRRLTEYQLTRLFDGTPADVVTFRVVQPIYTARPVFRDGILDPVPRRSGTLAGLDDTVEVPELPDAPLHKKRERVGRNVRGYVPSAEGEGLHECEAFDEALERVGAEPGKTRKALQNAAFVYVRAIGVGRVDVGAVANRLAEVALKHRSEGEVGGYNLPDLVQWVLDTLAGEPEAADPAPEPPPEIGADEASDRLRATLRRLVQQGLDYLPEAGQEPPHAVIRAQAGLGKTSVTLETLAELASGRTVHFYAPTHDLAEEVAERAGALGLPVRVMRGRNRKIGDGEHMCAKHELASDVARAGLPVWPTLCEDKTLIGTGVPHQCEHFARCPYVQQFRGLDGLLIVMTHEWLDLPRGKIPKAALSVIDERFYSTLLRTSEVALDRVTRGLSAFDVAGVEGEELAPFDLEEHAETARAVRAAIEAGEHPREHGVTVAALEAAEAVESRLGRPAWTIHPWMPVTQQRQIAREYATRREARTLAGLYAVLRDTHDRPTLTQRVQLLRDVKLPNGELQDRLYVRWAKLARVNGPAIVLDASADERIINRVLPIAEVVEIATPMQARVVQVVDTVCSKRKLMSSRALRERVVALARREAARGKRVLLVSYKPVIEEIGKIEGVETAHFGKLRGIDAFKGHDVVIVAGREQPWATSAEAAARALFGDDDEPLELPGELADGRRWFVTRGGVPRFGPVQVHPDARVQAIVEQIRERETEQAVARLRLVHRENPATVYLLSNMPTRLPIDEFVKWSELLPNKAEMAAQAADGIELLTASEMARCSPERWPTSAAARMWRSRQEKPVTKPLKDSYRENVTGFSGQRGAVVRYRTAATIGRRGPWPEALIPAEMATDRAAAERALADVVGELAAVEWLVE